MDRRPDRLGASRCRFACSARTTGHATCNRDAQHAQHLGPLHHDTRGSTDDDDDSADPDDNEARGHVRRVFAPVGRFPIQQISTLRRMEFSPEA
jgi:hypothetical protein